jgi:hypothetical protein
MQSHFQSSKLQNNCYLKTKSGIAFSRDHVSFSRGLTLILLQRYISFSSKKLELFSAVLVTLSISRIIVNVLSLNAANEYAASVSGNARRAGSMLSAYNTSRVQNMIKHAKKGTESLCYF